MDARAYNPRIAAENIKLGMPIQPGRGVGKTTAAILQALSVAMNNPSIEARVNDPDLNGLDHCKMLAHETGRMIKLLALTDVTVRVGYPANIRAQGSPEHKASVWVKSDFAHIFKVPT